jgi:phage terminase large subunit
MLSGPLYWACTRAADQWKVISITGDPDDPKRSPRIPLEHARAQIEQYGRDNPWVMTNILGLFPPSSPNSLIGPDEVREAMRRSYPAHQIGHAAKVLGVDCARFGDDTSVIRGRAFNFSN